MRTIIAGSRTVTDPRHLEAALAQCGWVPTVVISGTALGADSLGEDWAAKNNVKVERFYPNWTTYGKGAGFVRNKEMAENAEALIALWDGKSRGTSNMIDHANKRGLKVYIHRVE